MNREERKFEFKPEFKAMAAEALTKLTFSQVHGVMNLIRRESNVYTESESNAIVGFLGEMSYRDVAHIFDAMPSMVTEVTEKSPKSEGPSDIKTETPVAEEANA